MDFQTFAGLAHSLQTAAIAAIILVVCISIPKLKHRAQLSRLPTLGECMTGDKNRKDYLESARQLYAEGYRKVNYATCSIFES